MAGSVYAIFWLLSLLLHIKCQGVCCSTKPMQRHSLSLLFLFSFKASKGHQHISSIQKLQKAWPLPPCSSYAVPQTSRSPPTLFLLAGTIWKCKKYSPGARETAHRLRALVSPPKDLGSLPRPHVILTTICNSRCGSHTRLLASIGTELMRYRHTNGQNTDTHLKTRIVAL